MSTGTMPILSPPRKPHLDFETLIIVFVATVFAFFWMMRYVQ